MNYREWPSGIHRNTSQNLGVKVPGDGPRKLVVYQGDLVVVKIAIEDSFSCISVRLWFNSIGQIPSPNILGQTCNQSRGSYWMSTVEAAVGDYSLPNVSTE